MIYPCRYDRLCSKCDRSIAYKKVISCDEAAEWIVAMIEEIESLYKNQASELVNLSREQKIVGCKWIFKKKKKIQMLYLQNIKHAWQPMATVKQSVLISMKYSFQL